ncbi:unnamed protein product [Fraxinus pennsylvanica]|uniref:Uncharacterized protein n=1 Tax=Fraxinus pennsylvanica TaxID=56036 RepID=A0AAD2DSZ6_9LAMI|nr:unnamed protein product [Fraxinus pennsylvanica]
MERMLHFLNRFGGVSLILRQPAILNYDLEAQLALRIEFFLDASRKRKLHPRIDFLMQCGLNSQDIFKFLTKAPLFSSLSFEENLACKLVFLVKYGYENMTRALAMAMGAVTRTSCKNL